MQAPVTAGAAIDAGQAELRDRTLPLRQSGAAPAASARNGAAEANSAPAFAAGQAPHLLAVDDQDINRRVLQQQLQRLGIDCRLAASGAEALELFAAECFDIVITDCFMPQMSGLELTKRLRALEESDRPRTVIIAFTAYAMDGIEERCYEAGADDYLAKPLRLETLADRLQHWYGSCPAPSHTAAPDAASQESAACAPPIVIEDLARILGDDDRQALVKVAQDFAAAWQGSLASLRHPIMTRQADALAEAAHAAKGVARYGAAPRLVAGCARLEQFARARDWQEAASTFAALELETKELATYLEELR